MKLLKKLKNRQRLRKNLHRFSQKTVNYAKYMREIYIENGLAFISCKVKSYHDIIDRFSVEDYEWLDESFARYIESNAAYIPTEYPIVIEIIGGHFSKAQKETIEETILDYYGLSLGDKQIEMNRNLRRIVIIAIISILVACLEWFLDVNNYSVILQESIMILVWFFVEDLVELILERIDLQEEKTDAAQLASVAIRFSDKFNDDPVPDEEAEEIIAEIFDADDSDSGDEEEAEILE